MNFSRVLPVVQHSVILFIVMNPCTVGGHFWLSKTGFITAKNIIVIIMNFSRVVDSVMLFVVMNPCTVGGQITAQS